MGEMGEMGERRITNSRYSSADVTEIKGRIKMRILPAVDLQRTYL